MLLFNDVLVLSKSERAAVTSCCRILIVHSYCHYSSFLFIGLYGLVFLRMVVYE